MPNSQKVTSNIWNHLYLENFSWDVQFSRDSSPPFSLTLADCIFIIKSLSALPDSNSYLNHTIMTQYEQVLVTSKFNFTKPKPAVHQACQARKYTNT